MAPVVGYGYFGIVDHVDGGRDQSGPYDRLT